MRRVAQTVVAAGLSALVAIIAACGGSSNSSNVVAPSATLTNDVFNGVVQVLGTNVHNFTVTTPGSLSVTLTSTSPQTTLTMGLGIGTPNGAGGCTFIQTTQAAASTTTAQLSGSVTASGQYCIAIGDVGNAAGPITYSITVSHT
jgi:hypothetical protein